MTRLVASGAPLIHADPGRSRRARPQLATHTNAQQQPALAEAPTDVAVAPIDRGRRKPV
jgi:hypothetical protein